MILQLSVHYTDPIHSNSPPLEPQMLVSSSELIKTVLRPRANWIGTVKKDLQEMILTWEEAEVAALDRQEWRQSVAQCIHLDVG